MLNRFVVLALAILLLTMSIIIFSPGTVTGFLTNTGQFDLGNEAIGIEAVYLNGAECSDNSPTDCTVNPVENTTSPATVTVTILDYNGNCDEFTSNNGTAYFCVGNVAICNATNAKHTVTDLEYDAGDGQWGSFNEYCNLTGTATDFYFYEVNGTYTVNVTVYDGASNYEWDLLMYYNELSAIIYPSTGSTINMGALTMNNWNIGAGQEMIQNSGNIVVDLNWNATDFEGITYSDIFEIDGINLQIDDDPMPFDINDLTKVNISDDPTNQVMFSPSAGLMRCGEPTCSVSPSENATMLIYWHIYIPTGLHSDTYEDTIEVTTSLH